MTRRGAARGPGRNGEPAGLPNTFLGLPLDGDEAERARFVVLPVPFERTTSCKKGTREGPQAILRASHFVERFDEEVWGEPWKAGILTAPPYRSTEETGTFLRGLADVVEGHVKRERFVVTLGGERTIAEGPVAAYARAFKGLTVLQIDAHANLRGMHEGRRYDEACTAHRLRRYAPLVQVGVRSVAESEAAEVNAGNVRTFLMHKTIPFAGHIEEVVAALGETVYVTFDLDGLDPAVVPGVGTPVPGGLSWSDATGLLRRVAEMRRLVGLDVCELSPQADSAVSEAAAARLVYKTMAYVWARERS